MAKLEHKNLFAYGEKPEIYAAFQRDFDRDTWIHVFWRFVLFACAIAAITASGHYDTVWIFAGLIATERALSKFIDNSNRNWTMHVIDWIEAGRPALHAEE